MDDRNILNLKRDVKELQVQHNKLTALCSLLYSNLKSTRQELYNLRSGASTSVNRQQTQQQHHQSQQQQYQQQQQRPRDATEIHADEILRQLSQSN